jgi:hypothetical protein
MVVYFQKTAFEIFIGTANCRSRKPGFEIFKKFRQEEQKMLKETSDIEKLYKCVRSFWELGTGRKRRTVLVGDSEDARTSNFSFAGCVHQNWPCKGQVTLRNDHGTEALLWASTQTVDGKCAHLFFWNGQPAYMFFWNELTEDLWHRQLERTRLWEWIRTAEPEDREAMAELIVEETQSGYRATVYSIPQFTDGVRMGCKVHKMPWPDLQRIEIEIRKLSVPALRKLNSLTSTGARSESKTSVERVTDRRVAVCNESHQAA